MIFFYLLSILPAVIGAALWIFNKRIVLWEWAAATAAAFVLSGLFHLLALQGMTRDEECISGQIVSVRQFSAWQEAYEEAVYRTETYTVSVGSGKNRHRETRTRRVFDHWRPETRWHREYWQAYSNIDTTYDIDIGHYNKLVNKFGPVSKANGKRTTGEHNSHMIGGDPYDYVSNNRSSYIEPIVEVKSFENRIKAAPTVFSFIKVPPEIKVFDWPRPNSPWVTNRVLGTAQNKIRQNEWDKMNAVLGPQCQINLIIVGFDSDDTTLLQYQEAKFIGGKKNDLVISFCGSPDKPLSVKVFGWSESETCKRNIESWIVENGVSEKLIDYLKTEIPANYKRKDWHKWDYISIEPKISYYYWFLFCLIIVEGGLYWVFSQNFFDKEGKFSNVWETIANL